MNKRGLSHIEFILAAVLFISAITVALFFFSPIPKSRTTLTTLDTLVNTIISENSADVITYSVNAADKKDSNKNDQNTKIIINNLPSNDPSVIAITPKGDILKTKKSSIQNGLEIDVETSSNTELTTSKLFYIHLSNGFQSSNSNSNSNSITNVKEENIISANNRTILSEQILNSLPDTAASLRKSLKMPKSFDFSLSLTFLDKKIFKTTNPNVPLESNIYTKNKRVEVIKKDGQIGYADLKVNLW